MDWMGLYREEIHGRLLDFRQEQSYTDVEVRAGDQVFHCHRVVLAAMSPFFDAMFRSDMQEKLSGQIELQHDEETVQDALHYIYTGKNVVTSDNAFLLYDIAKFLQIPSLIKLCDETLRAGISKDSCLATWRMASIHGCEDIVEKARTMVLRHFEDFITEETMEDLTFDELKSLLTDPFLNCDPVNKTKALLLWTTVGMETRSENARSLIETLIKSAGVSREVVNEEIKKLEAQGKTGLESLKQACLQHMTALSLQHRPAYSDESVITIGGEDGVAETGVRRFSFRQHKWFGDLTAVPQDPGYNFAVCALDGVLYLSGGSANASRFYEYDAAANVWRALPNMPVGRREHAMEAVPGRGVYVLAGLKASEKLWEVHRFDPAGRTWTKAGGVHARVRSPSSVTVGDMIYLLGGGDLSEGDGFSPSNIAQSFDTRQGVGGRLEFMLPFKSKSQKLGAVCVSGCLYAVINVQGKGHVYVIHQKLKAEEIGEIENCPTKGFGCVAYGDKFLVVGGENDRYQAMSSMIQFNPATRQAVSLPLATPVPLNKFLFANVTIS